MRGYLGWRDYTQVSEFRNSKLLYIMMVFKLVHLRHYQLMILLSQDKLVVRTLVGSTAK